MLLQKNRKMMLLIYVALILVNVTIAQASEKPTAGTILEETRRVNLNPTPPPGNPQVQVEQALRPPLSGNSDVKISVSRFHITGQDIFLEKELLKLLPDPQGKELSLPEIEVLSRSITAFLHRQGYIMAGVYVPAQQIKNGVVELAVVMGQYDKIVFRKQINVSDSILALQLGEVQSGAYIKKDSLERAIWLLGDLAGMEAKAILAPGDKSGTANLYLDILPKGKLVSGDGGVDNYGNRFTGRNQLFADVAINNFSARGDQLLLNGLTAGNGLNSVSVSYQLPFLTDGGYLESGYSHMHYLLGQDFSNLNAGGVADIVNLSYKYTFHRSRQSNLYGQFGYFQKKLTNNVSGVSTDKSSHTWVAGINGDSFDTWGGGGNNSYSLIYNYGWLNIDSASALAQDTPVGTRGRFGKWNMTASRQQFIDEQLSLVLLLSGQLADKNLDSSEKMSLGGACGVRAYPQGEASGDNGLLFSGELRWTVPMRDKKAELLQLVGFIDVGTIIINKNPWPGLTASNTRTLKGAGLGAVWNNPSIMAIKAYYAWKLNSSPATSDTDKNGRLWLLVTSYF